MGYPWLRHLRASVQAGHAACVFQFELEGPVGLGLGFGLRVRVSAIIKLLLLNRNCSANVTQAGHDWNSLAILA